MPNLTAGSVALTIGFETGSDIRRHSTLGGHHPDPARAVDLPNDSFVSENGPLSNVRQLWWRKLVPEQPSYESRPQFDEKEQRR